MASIFYDPKVFAWGDAIGEGIKAYSDVKDVQLKELQRQKLYEDLQKEASVREGLQGIQSNQAAGLYSPTVTQRDAAVIEGTPAGKELYAGADLLPGETLDRTTVKTTVPAKRSMLADMRDIYIKAGAIDKAYQVDQMLKIETQLNTEKYAKVGQLIHHIGQAEKDLNVEAGTLMKSVVAPMLKESGDPLLSKIDLSGVSVKKISDIETIISKFKGASGNDSPFDIKVKIDADGKPQFEFTQKEDKAHNVIELPSPDGRSAQKWQYNPKTRQYDIPLGKPYLVKSQVPNVKVNMVDPFDKVMVSKMLTELPKLKSEALNQKNNVDRINRALTLVDKGVTGKGGQVKAWLAPYAEMIGMSPDSMQNMSDSQLYQMLTRVIVGPMRLDIIGPGPVSEWEQKLMQQISGGGGAAKQAAQELLGYYKSAAVTKVKNYNDTLSGLETIYPKAGAVHKKIEIGGGGSGQSSAPGRIKVDPSKVKLR